MLAMIVKYLKSLTATFNPLSPDRSHKIPRILLSFLGPNARLPTGGNVTVKTNMLPSKSKESSSLLLSFKDGKELQFVDQRGKKEGAQKEGALDLSQYGINDVVEEVDRHSRMLMRKEDLAG